MLAPRISASALARIEACPSCLVLPHVLTTSEAADRGTALHLFAERVVQGEDPAELLSMVPEAWRETAARINFTNAIGDLPPEKRLAEVAYSYNAKSRRVTPLGHIQHRQYPAPGIGDVFGTVDVVGFRSWDGKAVVADWKFGQDQTAVQENLQLRFAALAMATHQGLSEVEARILYVRASGRVDADKHVFSAMDLEDAADELEDIYGKAFAAWERRADRTHLPLFTPGDHCVYCPAAPGCPAQVGLVRSLVPDLEAISGGFELLTPEQLGAAYTKYKQAKRIVEKLHEAFGTLARTAPIPLDGEHEVRETVFMRSSFDKDRALELLQAYGATEDELASCQTQVQASRVDVCRLPGAAKPKRRKKVVDVE